MEAPYKKTKTKQYFSREKLGSVSKGHYWINGPFQDVRVYSKHLEKKQYISQRKKDYFEMENYSFSSTNPP